MNKENLKVIGFNIADEDNVLEFLRKEYIGKETYLTNLIIELNSYFHTNIELSEEVEEWYLSEESNSEYSHCIEIGEEDEGWEDGYYDFKFEVIDEDLIKIIDVKIQ
jgi:hypothetical protein